MLLQLVAWWRALHVQPRITTHARCDPAPRQRRHGAHCPGVGEPRHPGRIGHHATPVALVHIAPAQGYAGAAAAARDQYTQRTGFSQATQTTAIAGRTLGRLGRCFGMQPHHGGWVRGWYGHERWVACSAATAPHAHRCIVPPSNRCAHRDRRYTGSTSLRRNPWASGVHPPPRTPHKKSPCRYRSWG